MIQWKKEDLVEEIKALWAAQFKLGCSFAADLPRKRFYPLKLSIKDALSYFKLLFGNASRVIFLTNIHKRGQSQAKFCQNPIVITNSRFDPCGILKN